MQQAPLQPDKESPSLDLWPLTFWHLNVTVLFSVVRPLIGLLEFPALMKPACHKHVRSVCCFFFYVYRSDDFIANVSFFAAPRSAIMTLIRGTALLLRPSSDWVLLCVAVICRQLDYILNILFRAAMINKNRLQQLRKYIDAKIDGSICCVVM